MNILNIEPLSKAAFAPFGDVIEIEGSSWFHINQGTTERYHRLGEVQIEGADGAAVISLARGDAFDVYATLDAGAWRELAAVKVDDVQVLV